jgi:ABC-type glycerol-3-phosphate transport system substrate-binding protein
MKVVAIRLLLFLLWCCFCLLQSDARAAPSSPKITFFHYFSGALSGGLAEMVATVNAGREDGQVVAQGLDHEAFKSMIHATLERGNPPELFSYWAGAKTQELVDGGHLLPLDDLWREAKLEKRFSTAVANQATRYNGKRYLLPITQHFVVFFYNTRVFAEHALAPPTTWDELLHFAADLNSKGIDPFALGAKERWPAQFWFDYLLLRQAGPAYRQRLMVGEASYGDAQVEQAFATLSSLVAKGYFNDDANDIDWTEALKLVCSGRAAMTLMGTWALPAFAAEGCGLAEESGFDFFAFPPIDAAIPKVAVGPVDGIVLTRASTHEPLAKSLLGYFSEVDPQIKFSVGSGAFSPNALVPKDIYSPLKKRIEEEMVSAPEWAFNYDLATRPAIAEEGLDSFSELLAFPDQYLEILRHLRREIAEIRHQP